MSHRRHNNNRSNNSKNNKTWSNNTNRNGGAPAGGANAPKLRPCKNFMGGGTVAPNLSPCSNPTCKFAHVCQCFKSLGSGKKVGISGIQTWKKGEVLQIFTSSHDGIFRLYDTSQDFSKVFEHQPGTRIDSLHISHNRLFCGYEGKWDSTTGLLIPVGGGGGGGLGKLAVGCLQMWDLSNSSGSAVEFQRPFSPYASNRSIKCIKTIVEGSSMIILCGDSGGRIGVWKFDGTGIMWVGGLEGHCGEVSSLIPTPSILWSTSFDGTIRLWDVTSLECKHVILSGSGGEEGGHKGAITCSTGMTHEGAFYVLTGGKDGHVKCWDQTANSVISTQHGQGVESLSCVQAEGGVTCVVVGMERGNVMVRAWPSFENLYSLDFRYTFGHSSGPVRVVEAGENGIFFTGAEDGKCMVWQMKGDIAAMIQANQQMG